MNVLKQQEAILRRSKGIMEVELHDKMAETSKLSEKRPMGLLRGFLTNKGCSKRNK